MCSFLPSPVGRHTFFLCPHSEAILGDQEGLGLLRSQEQGTEGYHGWMRLADFDLQEVAVRVVAWGGWEMAALGRRAPDSP